MTHTRKTWARALLLASVSLVGLSPLAAHAQASFPGDKPVTFVVPYPPGGGVDTTGRIVAQALTESTGMTIVVENRSGAGGVVGMGSVSRAQPDGHTVGVGSPGNVTIAPSMNPKLPYDPLKDLEAVAMAVRMPALLVAPIESPFSTVQELVAHAKANQGKLSYGSGGNGTVQHLAGEMFSRQAELDVTHVPYRGATPLYTDLIAGRIDYAFIDTSAITLIRAGKVKLLAVTTAERYPLMPEAVTVAESGLPGYEALSWYGFFVPKGTPAETTAYLNRQIIDALKQPAVQEKLNAQVLAVAPPLTPAEFQAFINADTQKVADLAKAINLGAE